MAIMTLCLWPPESWNGYSFIICSTRGTPVFRSMSSAFFSASFFDIFSCCRTHSATWSPIFMTGFRLVIGSWKIMEILLPRSFLCCSFVSFTMSSPSSRISPSAIFPFVPVSNPITERDVTLFPLPDSPTIPSVAPRRSSTSTPSTALITPPSV